LGGAALELVKQVLAKGLVVNTAGNMRTIDGMGRTLDAAPGLKVSINHPSVATALASHVIVNN
jgi:hypothetical protein